MAVKKPGKLSSSEDKIKDLSLFFLQGRTLRFEGLPDGAPLKVGIVTSQEGEDKKHVEVPLRSVDGGAFELLVPDVFPDDGPDTYLICGVEYPLVSLTVDQHEAWEKFAEERKLSENISERNQIAIEINKTIPSDEDINRMMLELPRLMDTRTQLMDKKAELTRDLNTDDKTIAKVTARIALTTTEMKESQEAINAHSDKHDFHKLAVANSPHRHRLQKLRDEYRLGYLEYAHTLATEKELTKDAFEVWKNTAVGSDFDNAEKVVSEGNDLLTLGQDAQPLNRDQRRKAAMNSLKN